MTLLPVATTRWCAARSTFMHCRGMSSHAFPTHQEMAAYLKPVEERIAKYRLDLETNPLVLDKLAAEGKISTYTAEFFKKEILKREKEIKNGEKMVKQFWYIGVPLILIAAVNAYFLEQEENEHLAKEPPHSIAYPYLGVVKRKFGFGDGHHSFFFNKERNFDRQALEE